MTDAMEDAGGSRLGNYTLLRKLGQGGMGEVYLARDSQLEREVAIKVLPKALRDEPDRRTRFLREARAVAQLSHPNVTQIFEVGEHAGRDFLAFEYVPGQTLEELVAQRPLSLSRVLELALPLADAVQYAHERGIVHRDIKPANVIVTERGHPKLLDFGLAKRLNDGSQSNEAKNTTLTVQGSVFGTPAFMSPEQALGRAVDARSDVFSFGSLLYQLVSQAQPFEGQTVGEVVNAVVQSDPVPLERRRPEVPPGFATIVRKAMRKEPSERYQTMGDLVADLRHFKRETESGIVPAARPARLRARLITGALALALVAALAVGLKGLRGAGPTTIDGRAPGSFVAVLLFENLTDPGDADSLGAMLSHMLTAELTASEGLDVLSQQRVFETARRLGSEDGRVDRTLVSQVAAEAGIHTMVLGQIARVKQDLVATVSLVDAATGRELSSHRARGSRDEDLFGMVESLGTDLRASLQATKQASVLPTDSVDAYREFVRGFDHLQQGEWALASERLREATRLDPEFAEAYYWLAVAAGWVATDRKASVQAIERALELADRLSPELRRLVPLAYRAISGTRDPLADLEALVAADPSSRDAWYFIGEIYTHSVWHVDPERAARAFERALSLDPSFRIVESHVAINHLNAGNRDRGRAALKRWKGESSTEADILLYTRFEESETLLALYEGMNDAELEVLAEAPFAYAIVFWLAIVYLDRLDDPRLAADIEHWRVGGPAWDVLTSSEGGVERFLAPVFVLGGHLDAATKLLEGAVDYEDVDNLYELMFRPKLVEMLSRLRSLEGDEDGAVTLLEEHARLPVGPRVTWLALRERARRGDLDAAREWQALLEEYVQRIDSATVRLYRDLGLIDLQLAEGRPAEAARALEEVLASGRQRVDWFVSNSEPTPWLLETLATAYERVGDGEARLGALRRLVDHPANRVDAPVIWMLALFELGRLELERGNTAAGRARLERFLAGWETADLELKQVRDARALLER